MTPLARRASGGARVVLAVAAFLLLVMALHKVATIQEFTRALSAHGVLPTDLVRPTAWATAVVESIVAVIALVYLAGMRGAWLASIALEAWMLGTGGYLVSVAAASPAAPTDCGCGFGRLVTPGGWAMLAGRNCGAAVVIGVLGWIGSRGTRVPASRSVPQPPTHSSP